MNRILKFGKDDPAFLTSLFFVVWVAMLVTSCGGLQQVAVEPPTISDPKISAPTPQVPDEEIGVSIDVSSVSGVTLTYDWRVDGGEIVRGQGSPAITYRTPREPGIYNVRVFVRWNGSSAEKVTTIRVEAREPVAESEPLVDTPVPDAAADEAGTEPEPAATLEPPAPTSAPEPATSTPTPLPDPTATPTTGPARRQYGLVVDAAGIDDNGFNQLSWQGMQTAQQEFGVEVIYLEGQNETDYQDNLNQSIQQGFDGVIAVGFNLAGAVQTVSAANPSAQIIIVDFPSQTGSDMGMLFAVDQASFLAGYLAAGMSETGIVCTYGGMNIPPVVQFMVGFAQGVRHYNERNGTSVQVLGWRTDPALPGGGEGIFVDAFDDPGAGRHEAEVCFNTGGDVIFPVAGPTGTGSAEVAQATGRMMIGVDLDYYEAFAAHRSSYLTSVQKNYDQAVVAAVRLMESGTYAGGSNYLGTLENNGTGLAPFYEFEDDVPAGLKADLAVIAAKITTGEISTGWPVETP